MLWVLLFNAALFFLSHLFLEGGKAKFLVIIFLLVFILVNVINFSFKRLFITDEYLEIKSLGGVRRVMFDRICDITPLKLKGRYVFIISDNENYAFLSSMFEKIEEIIQIIKEKTPTSALSGISNFNCEDLYRKQRLFVSFLILSNIFLLLASCYNFLTYKL